MKIVQLTASNVKRLSAVEITPEGNVVTITGANGQGKTSILDAIAYALAGKDIQPPEVIRRGEKRAQVLVDLGDYIVERRWTANDRSSLVVKNREGLTVPSPQKALDALVGKLTFDPLSFTRMEPKKQVDVVRELAGLDFTALEQRRQALYDRRTEVNREVTRLKTRVTALEQQVVDPDAAPVLLTELLAQQQAALERKAENDKVRSAYELAGRRYAAAKREHDQALADVAELEKRLERARELAKTTEGNLNDVIAEGKAARTAVDALVDPDLVAIREQLQNAEQTNEQARKAAELRELRGQLAAQESGAQDLNEKLEQIDAEKGLALEKAKFPIAGLAFSETGVTFNGLPLEQASAAEQLRVSVAIGIALNPKIRVLLIRDASLLDKTSLRLVAQMAEAADCQVWLERVAGDGETGIVIEDGHVAGDTTSTPEAPALSQ